MTTRNNIIQWYNNLLPFYDTTWPFLIPSYNESLQRIQQITSSLIKNPDTILDLGCGTGIIARLMKRQYPPCKLYLCDVSQQMLETAYTSIHGHTEGLLPLLYGSESLMAQPLPQFDISIAHFALHHLTAQQTMQLYTELYQLTKPDGMVIITEEVVNDAPSGKDIVAIIRKDFMAQNQQKGLIAPGFIQRQKNVPQHQWPPFHYARIEDHTSWLANAGFAVTTPFVSLGSALLVAIKNYR